MRGKLLEVVGGLVIVIFGLVSVLKPNDALVFGLSSIFGLFALFFIGGIVCVLILRNKIASMRSKILKVDVVEFDGALKWSIVFIVFASLTMFDVGFIIGFGALQVVSSLLTGISFLVVLKKILHAVDMASDRNMESGI